MKPKSIKTRMLLILQVLYKYADEKHPMNTPKIHKHLQEYGFECSIRSLGDTLEAMKSAGIQIHQSEQDTTQGLWIKNKLIADEDLRTLAFSVETNPYLSPETRHNLLNSLKDVATVYQEHLLKDCLVQPPKDTISNIAEIYCTIMTAIHENRHIRYVMNMVKCDRKTGSIFQVPMKEQRFSPKYLYQKEHHLYVLGYHHQKNRILSLPIEKIQWARVGATFSIFSHSMLGHFV